MMQTSWMVVIDLANQGITIDQLRDNDTIQLTGQWDFQTELSNITVYNYFTNEGWPEYLVYITRSDFKQFNDPDINKHIDDIFNKVKKESNVNLYIVSHNELISCCEFNNYTDTPKTIYSVEWLEKDYE